MSTLGKLIIAFVVAVVAGIISLLLPGIDGALALIIGILFFIVTTLILEIAPITKSLEGLRTTNRMLFDLLTSIFETRGYFHDFYNVSLLSYLRTAMLREMKKGGIKIPKEEVPLFWLKMTYHFNESFSATSFIDPEEGWDLAYTKLALAIQTAKAKENKITRRVFIVETKEELNSIIPIIKKQRDVGVDARFIFRSQINGHRIMGKIKLETLDFTLIDGEFLSLILLDKDRKIKELQLQRDRNLFQKYHNFYTHLFNESSIPEL